MDHVNGGGSAHREKLFGRDPETYGMYRWLRDNGFPEGCQILCLSRGRLQGARANGARSRTSTAGSAAMPCDEIKPLEKEEFAATPQPEQ
jgi:hypothetical protein